MHVIYSITSISYEKHDQCQQPNRIFQSHFSSELHLNIFSRLFFCYLFDNSHARTKCEFVKKKKIRCATAQHGVSIDVMNMFVVFISFFSLLNLLTAHGSSERIELKKKNIQTRVIGIAAKKQECECTKYTHNGRCEKNLKMWIFWFEGTTRDTVRCYCPVWLLITNWWMSENLYRFFVFSVSSFFLFLPQTKFCFYFLQFISIQSSSRFAISFCHTYISDRTRTYCNLRSPNASVRLCVCVIVYTRKHAPVSFLHATRRL